MNNQSKVASLAIATLLVLTPFLQISPATATNLSDALGFQLPETSSALRPSSNSRLSSSGSGQLTEQFVADWNKFQSLSAMFEKSVIEGFMTSQIKALNESVVSAKLDSGTERSLVAKLNAAFNKASDASPFILKAQPGQANDMLNASDNVLRAFINEVAALQGGKISPQLASQLITSAQNLIHNSTASGSELQSIIPFSDLTVFNALLQEIQDSFSIVKADIQQLIQAGFTVTVTVYPQGLVIEVFDALVVLGIAVVAAATAVTLGTAFEMSVAGHPLSPLQIAELEGWNLLFFTIVAGSVLAFHEILVRLAPALAAILTASVVRNLPELLVDYYDIAGTLLDQFLGPFFDRQLFSLIESVLSPMPVLVRSLSITDTTFGRAVVNYFARSTFFGNGRFWIFFWNGASVNFVTSPDGQSWSTPTLVSAASRIEDAPEWSIWFDGTYVHYAIACCSTSPFQGNDIFYRRGVPQADGTIAWSAPEQRLSLNAKYPMLTVDDLGFPWIIYQNVGASFRIDGVKSSSNDGTFTIQTGFPVVINPVCCGLGVSILSPMSGGKMLIESNAACCFGVPLQVQAWTGSSFLSAVTVGTTNGYAQGVSEGDRVHLVFLDGSNNIMDKVYDFASNSIVSSTLIVTGGSGVPVLTRDPSNRNIFVFYTTSNQVLFLKRDGSTGQWSASPTTLVTEPSGFWSVGVTVSYQPYGGRFSLAYVRNTSAPQELMFFPFFG